MDFEQLKIFIAVAEHCSFTRAAEELYISHSTTSRNVAALEESLNVRLFSREGRSVRLTDAGQLLYREGQSLLQKAEELENEVRNAYRGFSGKLKVASVNLDSIELSDVYKEFCLQCPDVVLGIYKSGLSEIFGQVNSGGADLGVTFSYVLPKDTENFEIRKVATEKFCAIVSEGHPLAKRGSVKAEELRDLSYVSVGEQRSEFSRRIEDTLLRGRARSSILSVPTLESLFLQVRNGNGISLVPYPIAREYGSGCDILEVEDLNSCFDVVVFWRKDNPNPTLSLFIGLMTGKGDPKKVKA